MTGLPCASPTFVLVCATTCLTMCTVMDPDRWTDCRVRLVQRVPSNVAFMVVRDLEDLSKKREQHRAWQDQLNNREQQKRRAISADHLLEQQTRLTSDQTDACCPPFRTILEFFQRLRFVSYCCGHQCRTSTIGFGPRALAQKTGGCEKTGALSRNSSTIESTLPLRERQFFVSFTSITTVIVFD